MPEPTDILVVGGGPAGAAAAGLLAAAGWRVTLCEHKPFPRPKVCGEVLSAGARPVLARLGVLEQFEALAGPSLRQVLVCPGGPSVYQARLPADATGHYPRTLARESLDTLLLRRAAVLGARVLQPCHVAAIHGSPVEGFVAECHDRPPLGARQVILAHGLAQRRSLAPPTPPTPPAATPAPAGWLCFKTRLRGRALPPDTIALAAAPGLYAGLVRTAPGTDACTLAFAVHHRRLAQLGSTPATQLAALRTFNPAFADLIGLAEPTSWLAAGPLQPGFRGAFDGRFYVGNAAGEVHALVGEGMTLALESAALLAEAVGPAGRELDWAGVGGRYAAAFGRNFWPRCRAADLFVAVFSRPQWQGAALAARVPGLLDWCVRRSGKRASAVLASPLHVRY